MTLATLNDLLSDIQTNWPAILLILGMLSSILSTVAVKVTNHPSVSTWLHKAIGFLAWAQHQDVGNWKLPFTKLKSPVVGAPVLQPVVPLKLGLILLAVGLAGHARAAIPVTFYAGPTLAPIEEISGKNPSPAIAGGFTEKLGFGSYEAFGHSWDWFEIGALQLGGLVPGGVPAGMLQLGAAVSTLNGIVGFGLLFDCVDGAGGGVCQGGPGTGPIYAVMFDVQAVVSLLGSGTALASKLPRGGL